MLQCVVLVSTGEALKTLNNPESRMGEQFTNQGPPDITMPVIHQLFYKWANQCMCSCVFRKHPRYSSINYVGSEHVNACFPEHQKPNVTHVFCYTGLPSQGSHRAGLVQYTELLLEERHRLPAIWTVKYSNPPGNKGQCCTFGHYWIIWDDLWWGWEENRRLWERCKWLDLRPIFISICLTDMWIKSPPSFWATRLFSNLQHKPGTS